MQPQTKEAFRLWTWIGAGALALILGVLAGASISWSWASITLQLLGSLVTLLGFLFAYLRASHRGDTVAEQLSQFFDRLFARRSPTQHTGSAHLGVTFTPTSAVGLTPLEDLGELGIEEQVDALATYIRERVNERTTELFTRVGALEVEVAKAHVAVDEKAEETYRSLVRDLEALRSNLDKTQVLDLRTAMFGIYLIAIGVALAYCV